MRMNRRERFMTAGASAPAGPEGARPRMGRALTRVYVDSELAVGQRLTVEGSAGNHIVRVLRLRVGDALTVFNGRGGEWGGKIDEMRRDTVQVSVLEHRDQERE